MSWVPYYGISYGYGLPVQNPDEFTAHSWQYVSVNQDNFTAAAAATTATAATEPPSLLPPGSWAVNRTGGDADNNVNTLATMTETQTPSTDTSFQPGQAGGSTAVAAHRTLDSSPENIILEIRKLCTDSQSRVQALSQAIGRQPGIPGNLQDLLNNDMRGLAQQFVTTARYCHLLEKKLEERTRATFQERTAERAAHEAHLESYRQQLKKANETIDRLSKDLSDFNNAYSKTERSRKVDLERKTEKLTEKINNQKRRINEQQAQIETLKRRVSDGSKLSKGSRITDNRDEDDSPELEFPHSATSELGDKRRNHFTIPQPKLPSGISMKDEEFLLNNLKNMRTDFGPPYEGFPPPPRSTRMERDTDFKYGPPAPPSYGPYGPYGPPMSGPLAPYGVYPPMGPYGAPGPKNGHQGLYHGYAPPNVQHSSFSRTRPGHSAHNSQSGHSGALILRRDDDADFDPETKIWKDMFMRLFKTVGGWSDTYCRQIIPGASEAATRNNPKLWEYMLKVAACYKDPQAAPKHALFMLTSPEHRTNFITRLLLQYIEQEMLHYKLWMGWDEETDRTLRNIGPMGEFVGHPIDQRRYARQQMRNIVESIVGDQDYSRFRTFKTAEHAGLLKDIAGPFLSPDATKSEASLGLHSIANLAMEISHKMMASRLSFTFTWNECAVKFSHDSHIALNSDQHGLALQHKHTRVMLVITPSISYRDHTGASIVPRGVTKAQVLIMN
ncbi:hypothetical protein VM1G_03488 [Cytospora mali]|uniref:Uncharacterized protein n=1 Tax=Cytospora mali TaxID=578113 RepID=A0A194VUE2_CYTMA|nr:hypothetical protein VM1G_03488 [Valsa mali]